MKKKYRIIYERLNYYASYMNVISYTIIITIINMYLIIFKDTLASKIIYIIFLLYLISIYFIYTGFKTIREYTKYE